MASLDDLALGRDFKRAILGLAAHLQERPVLCSPLGTCSCPGSPVHAASEALEPVKQACPAH